MSSGMVPLYTQYITEEAVYTPFSAELSFLFNASYSSPARKNGSKIALALWGGSLGFPVGVALMAWVGKFLGCWPPSPARLLKYAGNPEDKPRV